MSEERQQAPLVTPASEGIRSFGGKETAGEIQGVGCVIRAGTLPIKLRVR